jgi:hypothetical protein
MLAAVRYYVTGFRDGYLAYSDNIRPCVAAALASQCRAEPARRNVPTSEQPHKADSAAQHAIRQRFSPPCAAIGGIRTGSARYCGCYSIESYWDTCDGNDPVQHLGPFPAEVGDRYLALIAPCPDPQVLESTGFPRARE